MATELIILYTAISLCCKHGLNQSISGTSAIPQCSCSWQAVSQRAPTALLAPGEAAALRNKRILFGKSGAKPRRGLVCQGLAPAPRQHLPQRSPMHSSCAGGSVVPTCLLHMANTRTRSGQTSLHFLAFAFRCICSLLFISPRKGDMHKLQRAEKRSLGVSLSPKRVDAPLQDYLSNFSLRTV